MSQNGATEEIRFMVVVNDEEQYSIWRTGQAVPAGWRTVQGVMGTKEECLAYIESVWTDMTPKSLRSEASGIRA